MESGIIFGLTAALKTEITFKDGRVEQENFHNYQMLRIFESPEIEVHMVPSSENPTGVGEPGVPQSLQPWQTQSSQSRANAFAGCQSAQVISRRWERNHDSVHESRNTLALANSTGRLDRNLRIQGSFGSPRNFLVGPLARQRWTQTLPGPPFCGSIVSWSHRAARIVIQQAIHRFRVTTATCIFRM